MIASVNSNHEQAPAAVRCSRPAASRSTASSSAAARSAVNVGCRRWSATIFSAPCSRARASMRCTKLPPLEALPCRPYRPGAAHDQRAVAVGQRRVLAGELGERVDRARASAGRPRRRARRGGRRRRSWCSGARACAPRGARRSRTARDVDRPRAVGLGLADVDVVERRAVEDDVGLRPPRTRASSAAGVGDVELGVRERRDLARSPSSSCRSEPSWPPPPVISARTLTGPSRSARAGA